MNTFDQRLITLIRQLISWLVAGDYEAAQRRSRGIRRSADLMRDAVLRFGRTLVIPPDTAFAGIDAIEVRNAAAQPGLFALIFGRLRRAGQTSRWNAR